MSEISLHTLKTSYSCLPTLPEPLSFSGVSSLDRAQKNDITFLASDTYLNLVSITKAGALLCHPSKREQLESMRPDLCLLLTPHPYAMFAKVSQFFYKPKHSFSGQSELASIDASATVETSAVIFPYVFVAPGATVGARTVLYPGVFIGAGSTVGSDCILYPNSVVREGCHLGDFCILNPGAVIGGDGFGFAPFEQENVKIPQIGGVEIKSHVEVGSNSAIDRGTIGNTIVHEQTKIDNLVQIGHNTELGKASILCGQAAVAGSSKLGERVILAGQAGVAGHLTIGPNITIMAQAGVTKNLLKPGSYNGTPARPSKDYLRSQACLWKLSKQEALVSQKQSPEPQSPIASKEKTHDH